jgi:hypothetical protein
MTVSTHHRAVPDFTIFLVVEGTRKPADKELLIVERQSAPRRMRYRIIRLSVFPGRQKRLATGVQQFGSIHGIGLASKKPF